MPTGTRADACTPIPQQPHPACTGDCDNGMRDCTCGHAVVGMWEPERRAPWRAAALYLAALLVGVASAVLHPGSPPF